MLAIIGATIIDGNGGAPIADGVILTQGPRITAVGPSSTVIPPQANRITATGKFVIPGLLDANVHLLADIRLENLVRHEGRYEDLIAEAAQVALKAGLTTVFDTWGPRRALLAVRDRIDAGQLPGSRIFCAGNIVGFDGPFSPDFMARVPEIASPALVRRINAMWVENVGRHLMWLSPAQVAVEVRAYIAKGVNFVKYGSNDHYPGSFLALSPRVQAAIVAEAHSAGLTAQAHTMSVEGLHIAIEAGCDLIQHTNITGPVPIPEATLELLAQRRTGAVVFPFTQRRFEWFMQKADETARCVYSAMDTNTRNLIRSGAPLLMAWDANLQAPEAATDAASAWYYEAPDSPQRLGQGHLAWMMAMEEKGCPPMKMLMAATKNVAVAYGKERDLGTLEAGKIADLLILDRNPLAAAANYGTVSMVMKDGAVIDTEALPLNPILTRPLEPPCAEERDYVPFLTCPACARR